MAFRYTSTVDSAGRWTIDNIIITDKKINVADNVANVKPREVLPLTIVGYSTPDQIKLSYSTQKAGLYTITAYDIVGRRLYNKDFYADKGTQTYSITDLHLSSGMYFIKVGNGASYGVAKAIVQ
jgi:hypothetical protein